MRCGWRVPTDPGLYVGLMSGTSLDGVDGVLVRLPPPSAAGASAMPQVLAHAARRFDPALHDELLALNARGDDELHRGAIAANALAEVYAAVVGDLLRVSGRSAAAVRAIGAHGQTVRHRPDLGYTIQVNAPALLAERTGIAVVADFRSRDVAAGGQGAPLVPAFHRAVFASPGRDIAVLNLGGFANLSLLYADGRTLGFDTGPGNVLLDAWAQRHLGAAYDAHGAWAAQGRVRASLLAALLADGYFARPPPKSTGRDAFHAGWLAQRLEAQHAAFDAVDVQATLSELTARSVADALLRAMPQVAGLIICGGGARNRDLVDRIGRALPGVATTPSDAAGLPAEQVEAAAFAWLAQRALERLPGNLAAVTGATGPRVLGSIYPA